MSGHGPHVVEQLQEHATRHCCRHPTPPLRRFHRPLQNLRMQFLSHDAHLDHDPTIRIRIPRIPNDLPKGCILSVFTVFRPYSTRIPEYVFQTTPQNGRIPYKIFFAPRIRIVGPSHGYTLTLIMDGDVPKVPTVSAICEWAMRYAMGELKKGGPKEYRNMPRK